MDYWLYIKKKKKPVQTSSKLKGPFKEPITVTRVKHSLLCYFLNQEIKRNHNTKSNVQSEMQNKHMHMHIHTHIHIYHAKAKNISPEYGDIW